MVYIYIFEDGEPKTSPNPPGNGDLQGVEDGVMQVLRVTDGKVEAATGAGQWEELPSAEWYMVAGYEGHE